MKADKVHETRASNLPLTRGPRELVPEVRGVVIQRTKRAVKPAQKGTKKK